MLLAFESLTAIDQDEKPKENAEQMKRRELQNCSHWMHSIVHLLHFTSVYPMFSLYSEFLYIINYLFLQSSVDWV